MRCGCRIFLRVLNRKARTPGGQLAARLVGVGLGRVSCAGCRISLAALGTEKTSAGIRYRHRAFLKHLSAGKIDQRLVGPKELRKALA